MIVKFKNNMFRFNRRIALMVSLVFFACSNFNGQPLKPGFTPGDLYNNITRNPELVKNFGGESFAWHATNGGDLFVKAYILWKDTAWLSWGIRYYEFLRAHMHAGPDGYIGLIGPSFRDDVLWNNEVISDALVANLMLEFCELVINDTRLKKIYGKKAWEYIVFCKKHMVEKWDKRNLWHETGDYADYIFGCEFVKPNDFSSWVSIEKTQANPWMSIQYNIANCMGITNLRLYRITGDNFYRDKAEKLFFRLKSNFQFFDNHYVWNYWSPFYEKDISYDSNRCNHWVNAHKYRAGYQAIEVSQIAEAYHTGVVFDSNDIQRIINTNLDVMWNKNREHLEFIMSTGRHPDSLDRNGENAVAGSGTLWSSLSDFSQVILDLSQRGNERTKASNDIGDKIQLAYFNNIVVKRHPGFRRKYAEGRPVTVRDVSLGNSPDLNFVGVIPYIIKRGQHSFVIAKSRNSGNLVIDIYSADGATKIKTIYHGSIIGDDDGLRGFRITRWDGIDPDGKIEFKGEYLVRWTLNGKYRDYAIKIE
ncbi:MAG: hypothetical protein ABI760_20925 [Ferruginibacter sp.]